MDSFLFGKRRISFSFLRSFFLRSLSPIFSYGMWYGFPFDLKFYVFCSFFLLFLKELLKRSRKFLFWKTGRGIYRSENPAPQVFYAPWRSLRWSWVNFYRFGKRRSLFSYRPPLSFWRPLSPTFVCLISEFRWSIDKIVTDCLSEMRLKTLT